MNTIIRNWVSQIHHQYGRLKSHHPLLIWVIGIVLLWLGFKLLSGLWRTEVTGAYTNGALPVKVATVIEQPMPILRTAPGTLSAVDSVSITPQVSGKLATIWVERGAWVKAGDLLLSIDKAPFEEKRREAEALLRQAEANLLQAEGDARRYASLSQKEYVSLQQAEQAQTAYEAQKANVVAQQAMLEQANIELGYTDIRSPLDGKLGDFQLNPGDFVKAEAEAPLMTINQTKHLFLDFHLNQSDFAKIFALQKEAPLNVNVYSEHNPSTILASGKVHFINNTIQPTTGTFGLKAKVDNAQDQLWPGMTVLVDLILQVEPNALVIPAQAIQFDQLGHFVYVVEEGKALIKRVQVDRRIENLAVIASGLKVGEQVILSISPDLANGRAVKVEINS